MHIERWIINLLILSLPFSWWLCCDMYKTIKKKDKAIDLQNNMIRKLLEKGEL